MLMVVSGPPGVGKSTAVQKLAGHMEAQRATAYTTRPPRQGEIPDVDYFFVDEDAFNGKELIAENVVFGHRYGMEPEQLEGETLVVAVLTKAGWDEVRERRPDAIGVYLIPPSPHALRRRLLRRHPDDIEEVQRRLDRYSNELSSVQSYDYRITAQDPEDTALQLEMIARAQLNQPHDTRSESSALSASAA